MRTRSGRLASAAAASGSWATAAWTDVDEQGLNGSTLAPSMAHQSRCADLGRARPPPARGGRSRSIVRHPFRASPGGAPGPRHSCSSAPSRGRIGPPPAGRGRCQRWDAPRRQALHWDRRYAGDSPPEGRMPAARTWSRTGFVQLAICVCPEVNPSALSTTAHRVALEWNAVKTSTARTERAWQYLPVRAVR